MNWCMWSMLISNQLIYFNVACDCRRYPLRQTTDNDSPRSSVGGARLSGSWVRRSSRRGGGNTPKLALSRPAGRPLAAQRRDRGRSREHRAGLLHRHQALLLGSTISTSAGVQAPRITRRALARRRNLLLTSLTSVTVTNFAHVWTRKWSSFSFNPPTIPSAILIHIMLFV